MDEVNIIRKRITEKENRINDRRKIEDLYKLRELIFTSRRQPFSCHLNQCVETRRADVGDVVEISDVRVDMESQREELNDVVY